MRTRAEKDEIRRGWQYASVFGWAIFSFALFLLLIAVPREMALNAPIQCEVYALARRGWGCAVLGDVFSNPILFWVSAIASAFFALEFLRSTGEGFPRLILFVPFHFAFIAVSAGSVRLVYFFQGHASTQYATATVVGIVCCCAGVLLSYFYLRRHRP